MLKTEFEQMIQVIRDNKRTADEVRDLGGITYQTVQSDKLGFDWKQAYVGEVLVKSVYVAQEVPVGTTDNPIPYYNGVPGINNAFYKRDDDTILVYMDGVFAEL